MYRRFLERTSQPVAVAVAAKRYRRVISGISGGGLDDGDGLGEGDGDGSGVGAGGGEGEGEGDGLGLGDGDGVGVKTTVTVSFEYSVSMLPTELIPRTSMKYTPVEFSGYFVVRLKSS